MSERRWCFAEEARQLAGATFRLHGRDPATGLDCVGLILVALERAALPVPPSPSYGLRNSDYSSIAILARETGFLRVAGQPIIGDIVVTIPGPAQRHFLICIERERFIHAHAGLGRVVINPGPLPWPTEMIFRLDEKD